MSRNICDLQREFDGVPAPDISEQNTPNECNDESPSSLRPSPVSENTVEPRQGLDINDLIGTMKDLIRSEVSKVVGTNNSKRGDESRSRGGVDSPVPQQSLNTEELREFLRNEIKNQMTSLVIDKNLTERGENGPKLQPTRFQTPPYKLTEQVLFRSWLTRLRSELEAYDLLDVLESTNASVPSYTEAEMLQRKSNVRNIILSRLDEKHLKIVEGERDPKRIIKRLEAHRESKTMVGELAYFKELHTMTFDPRKESIQDFLLNVNNLLAKVEEVDKEPYSDSRKKKILMLAVADTFPELIVIDRAQEGTMSFERAQQILLEEAALRKESEIRCQLRAPHALYTGRKRPAGPFNAKFPPNSKFPPNKRFKNRNIVCFRCGEKGHYPSDCPKSPNERMCYWCKQTVTDHISKTCPMRNGFNNQQKQPGQNTKDTRPQPKIIRRLKNRKGKQYSAKYSKFESDDEFEYFVDETNANDTAEEAQAHYSNVHDDFAGRANVTDSGKNLIKFIADSGANEHLINDNSNLSSIVELPKSKRVGCANKESSADIIINQKGILEARSEGNNFIRVTNIFYSQDLSENLFSLSRLADEGLEVNLTNRGITVKDPRTSKVVMSGPYKNRFWWLLFKPIEQFDQVLCANSNSSEEVSKKLENGGSNSNESENGGSRKRENCESIVPEIENKKPKPPRTSENLRDNPGLLWHKRLAHISKQYLETAGKSIPELSNVKFNNDILDCEACIRAKLKRKPKTSERYRYDKPLALVHSDLMGEISPSSYRTGYRYIVTFIDDYSRMAMAFVMHRKTEVHTGLKMYLEDMRRRLGEDAKIRYIRTDNGTEYSTYEMKEFLARENIEIRPAEPYTPEHNGTAERFNREIQEKVRAMLFDAGLPLQFWEYAVAAAVYLYNRTPRKALNLKTPFEVIHNRKPNLKFVRRFGCLAYMRDTKPQKSKFESRGRRVFIIGYTDTGYRVLCPVEGTILNTCDVVCIESQTFGDVIGSDAQICVRDPPMISDGDRGYDWFSVEIENENSNVNLEQIPENLNDNSNVNLDQIPENLNECPEKQIDSSTSKSELDDGDFDDDDFEIDEISVEEIEDDRAYFALLGRSQNTASKIFDVGVEPTTYSEALNSPEADNWVKSINEEYEALNKNETWTLVDINSLPRNTKVIDSKLVFKKKIDTVKNSIKFKSRLCARGFKDSNFYDKTEVFAPVARIRDVRFLLSVANKENIDVYQFDVKTAFLNGFLEKKVYMRIPEGYPCNEVTRNSKVCELKRALYGLKVSPKRWYIRFSESMKKAGFNAYVFQPCLFVWRRGSKFVILLLYVDDILITGNCGDKIREIKRKLTSEFEMTYLGEPKKFLGIEIIRNKSQKITFLHQKTFIEKLLAKFDEQGKLKSKVTPMITNSAERKTKNSTKFEICEEKVIPFREAIGSLLYLANGTRPDITYAVNKLSRRQSCYTFDDWKQVLRIFAYLKGTSTLGLCYEGGSNEIDVYVDASLGMNDDEGKSTTGYVIKVFNDVISWRTKKQNHVSQSSAEAEYCALSVAIRETTSIVDMCTRLLKIQIIPTVFEDNKSAIAMAKSDSVPALQHLTKLFFHYVRQEVQRRNVYLTWISTADQLGDFFTKALAKEKFEEFRVQLLKDFDLIFEEK